MGRTALVGHDGTRAREVLPAPWDVRTRVHEYGGGAYAVRGGTLVFSHVGDDRVHRLDAGAAEPVAITPPGPWRFGGLVAARRPRLRRARGPLPRPGAGQRAGAARPATATTPTVAWCWPPAPTSSRGRPSPPTAGRSPGSRGDHPSMPWDSTVLLRAALTERGAGTPVVVAGGRRRLGRPAGLRARRCPVVPVRRVGLVDRAPRHRLRPGRAARRARRPRRPAVGPGHGRPRRARRRPRPGALVGRRHGRARRARRAHR